MQKNSKKYIQISGNTYLSVVIPAYNEEKRIIDTVEKVTKYFSTMQWAWELIIVSDGSTDNTVEHLKSYCEQFRQITVIDRKENKGKGASVAEGMLLAKGKYRLFMDADSSTPIEEVRKLFPHVIENGVVIGSLGLPGAEVIRHESIYRIIGGRLGNKLIQFFVLPGIKDTQRGFKLFSEDAADYIFPKLETDRWGFDIEVLVHAIIGNFKIKEVPVRWTHDLDSKIRARAYIEVLRELISIWIRFRKQLP